jgi:hypothetical protein
MIERGNRKPGFTICTIPVEHDLVATVGDLTARNAPRGKFSAGISQPLHLFRSEPATSFLQIWKPAHPFV